MQAFFGTSRLFKLAIRRDRVRLPVWIVSLTLLVAGFGATYRDILKSPTDLIALVQLYLNNPSARIFALPSGLDLGSYAMMRAGLFIGIIIALLNIFLVVRHTRQNEETGREELVRSGRAGAYAGLAAALGLALLINIALAVLIALMFIANDFDARGAATAGASWGMIGLCFAAIAAVTAQLTKTTRGANGLAGATLGGLFMLSAIGNLLGTVDAAAYKVIPAWPSWFSPLGWSQLMRPYSENNWEWLIPAGFLIAVCTAGAFYLARRRDVGMGILSERRGPARASHGLLRPLGLVWRLQRGTFFGWLTGVLLFGVIMGSLTKSVSNSLASSQDVTELVAKIGGSDQLIAAFLSIVAGMLGSIVAIFTVQSILHMRTDEDNGTIEPILTARISRTAWMLTHTLGTGLMTVALVLGLGASAGLAAGISLSDISRYLPDVLTASLIQLPAMLVLGAIGCLLFGWLPRGATAVTWGAYALAMVCGPILSALINPPDWAKNLSPFQHTPLVPAAPVTVLPLCIMSVLAIGLVIAGLIGFRRRNIANF